MAIAVARVREILEQARQKRILVAGDLMLDEFVWGDVVRISPEAPVPVVHVGRESAFPGGAANVARNVREFCAWTGVLGLIGSDAGGARLESALTDEHIDVSGVVTEPGRTTTVKTRVIAHRQQVVRVDRERTTVPAPEAAAALREAARRMVPAADAVIISDYAKGVLNQALADEIRDNARRHARIVTVDPSPANPLKWAGVTAIKPNRSEALQAAGVAPSGADMHRVGADLLERWGAEMVLVTLGEEGMLLFERNHSPVHSRARAREVFDVSGAGDTAIAIFTLAVCSGATAAEATELATAASGIVVGKLGTATVTPAELINDFAIPH